MVFFGLGILFLGMHLPGQDGLCPNLDVLFGSYGFSVTYGTVWRITNALIKRNQLMQRITIHMRRCILLVLLYVFLTPLFSFNVQAGTVLEPPQATIAGTVTDRSGKPLAGVNIVVESKNVGAMSELNGSFSINAGPSDVLVFSMVGYKTLSMPIGGREELFVMAAKGLSTGCLSITSALTVAIFPVRSFSETV